MIKLAPKEYWKECLIEEAMLYCFVLNVDGQLGWRLPTAFEAKLQYDLIPENVAVWSTSDLSYPWGEITFTVIPVRDIKDD
jgi:hypothetical protein